jgi:hypothetical protein
MSDIQPADDLPIAHLGPLTVAGASTWEMLKTDRKRLQGATNPIFDDLTHRARLTVTNMNDVVDVTSLLLG